MNHNVEYKKFYSLKFWITYVGPGFSVVNMHYLMSSMGHRWWFSVVCPKQMLDWDFSGLSLFYASSNAQFHSHKFTFEIKILGITCENIYVPAKSLIRWNVPSSDVIQCS